MGRLLERAYSTFREEARQRGIDYTLRGGVGARDRVGRRPRAPDHLEPALERLPLDAGRRPHRPGARRPRTGRSRSTSRTPARGSRPTRASGSSGPSGRRTARGTGLGLPIARELAVALGGRIELQTEVGQGEPLPARPAEPQLLARSRRLRGARGRALRACSTRSSRSLTPLQPEETRSTSSARSSMRACRSASRSPSSRSSRRIAWLSSPRISARLRADREHLGAEAVVHGRADLLGQRRLELGGGCGERLDLDRASARAPPRARPARSARTRLPRSVLSPVRVPVRPRRRGYAGRRMDISELDYDLPAGADRAASAGAPRRLAAARLRPRDRRGPASRRSPTCRTSSRGELVVVNDTRVVPARIRLEQPTRRGAAARALEGDGVWEALARPTRRLTRRAAGSARSSCSSTSARAAGASGSTASPTARRRCRRTSPSRSPTRSATRPSTRDEAGLGRGADGRPALHAGAARAARRRARDAPRRPRHVPAARDRRRSRSTSSTASATASGPRRGSGSTRPSACSPSARRRCACSRRSRGDGLLHGRTTLFVTPGFEFRRVDALLTNFHLPRSTLLALVMAFAGVEETRRLYRLAVDERYRFYSFGDAMLIL